MKLILAVIAVILIMIGLVSMFTPIPGGTLLIAGGSALLICSSEKAAMRIESLRKSKKWINRPMTWMENSLGERLSGPMRRTRPTTSEETGEK